MMFESPSSQRLRRSWEEREHPEALILNHLDRHALEEYASRLGPAFAPALAGATSSLFCDSWEVETQDLWTYNFDGAFQEHFGYDVRPYMSRLAEHPDVRYDYRALLADIVLDEFFRPFTDICHQLGACSRVQCHGAPTDILAAYAAADIPESETVLFDPPFAQIAASAATLANKPIVSAEAFTCLYGWRGWPGPGPYQGEELTADLKLVADALFANGVNLIVWHGMPYSPLGEKNRFYASVHVGPDAGFAGDLPGFNSYLEQVSRQLRQGVNYSEIAVYLPLEDAWMKDTLPKELERPSAKYHWELQYERFPGPTVAYRPTWITSRLLETAFIEDGRLHCGTGRFRLLYVDVEWLDHRALQLILNFARLGLPVCLKKRPNEPGLVKHPDYDRYLSRLLDQPSVGSHLEGLLGTPPLVAAGIPLEFWCRAVGDQRVFFFANPRSRTVGYPLRHGQALGGNHEIIAVSINCGAKTVSCKLDFQPNQSLLVRVGDRGDIDFPDIHYESRQGPIIKGGVQNGVDRY